MGRVDDERNGSVMSSLLLQDLSAESAPDKSSVLETRRVSFLQKKITVMLLNRGTIDDK